MTIPRTVFQVWTGTNELNAVRSHCVETARQNIDANVQLLSAADIKLLNKIHKFHPAYEYLSLPHKADYLRVWLMNFIGGGYSDIKPITSNNNWGACFNAMAENPQLDIIGMKEVPGGSIPSLRYATSVLLSCGWFICRPHSNFTEEWFRRTTAYLDEKYEELAASPATDLRTGGPNYKIPWTGILGNIFQPLTLQAVDTNAPSVSNELNPGVDFGKPYR